MADRENSDRVHHFVTDIFNNVCNCEQSSKLHAIKMVCNHQYACAEGHINHLEYLQQGLTRIIKDYRNCKHSIQSLAQRTRPGGIREAIKLILIN